MLADRREHDDLRGFGIARVARRDVMRMRTAARRRRRVSAAASSARREPDRRAGIRRKADGARPASQHVH
ncbi:hypothetical protein, partial [Burkholderia oklahomensis]|uniref:hypothetical protein n=1 Tax=Burkholderia oklahomensis TaxID=342113 RepID=UPI001E47D238